MKILIVHQYFNTPESGGPLRSYYIAQGLKASGHEVEVITSYNGKYSQVKQIKGFRVHYLPVYYDNRLKFLRRILAFIKFAWLAYRKALTVHKVDLCYAISTPLSIGWVALRLKSKRSIPYIFEVGDLWPEAPIQMGILKSPWVINKVKRFERRIYLGAESLVALSPGIKEHILKTTPHSKVAIIPNISDCNFYQLESKDTGLENLYGVQNKTVITYFGAAGKANHLEYLLEAAKHAQSTTTSLHFLIAARGSELSRIRKLASQYKLDNLNFLPYCNRAQLKKLLNVSDAVYVSYADVPILTTGSPNKFFDGLAAGKLIIVNFHGWLRNITERHEFGFYADPKRPQTLVAQCCRLLNNREDLQKAQKNSRIVAETYFSRELAVQKLLKCLDSKHQVIVKVPEVYTLTA